MEKELPSMDTAEHRGKVTDYYNEAQPFYKYIWHWGTHGLHYGFSGDRVNNWLQAITNENEVLAEKARIQPGELVLDVGAGIGGSSVWLAKKRQARVVELDVVRKQLMQGKKLAEKKGVQPIGFIQGDYQILPFHDNVFDVVWSLESIEHAINIDSFVQESFRVLQPGGRIIIAGTFKGREDITPDERRKLDVGTITAGAFIDFRTANQVAEVMENTGFVNTAQENATNLVSKSSRHMTRISRFGLSFARIAERLGLTSHSMTTNTEWGTYQENLFSSGATSYNILLAQKPEVS